MNVLFICNKSPYPAKEGGPIAMNMFIEGLIENGQTVKVLAVNSEKYAISNNEIPEDYRQKTNIESVFIDLRIKIWGALKCFLQNKSYHIQRFISQDFEDKIIQILKKESFNIIQMESLFVTPYLDKIRQLSNAKIVLRAHNVEHKIWEDIAKQTINPFKKIYINHLAKTLKKYELASLSKFDGIINITAEDKNYFKSQCEDTPITDISFGIDLTKYENVKSETEFPSLFHLGAMNWIPNSQGIDWFIKHVWPEIHKQYPKLKLYLAGNAMPNDLLKINHSNICVQGLVDDPKKYISSKAIMIVPLFSSSGVRIKIIEGMAASKAIISTTKGAAGIQYENEKNILIADTKEEFIESVNRCIEDMEFTKELGINAKEFISKNHNKQNLIHKLLSFYSKI